MKAFYATTYGGPEVMTLGEVPDPKPGRKQALIKVHASSINPVDWKIRAGQMKVVSGWRFPKILGADFAGEVKEVFGGTKNVSPGDRVFGFAPIYRGAPGGHAEQMAVTASRLNPIPESLSYAQAASLPVAALTALNGFRLYGEVKGKTVLVNGATGGVGHFAVQIAKHHGAEVIAVCSEKNTSRARQLGADQIIDYRAEDFTRGDQRYDVVFDAYGLLGYGSAKKALAPRGTYMTPLPSAATVLSTIWHGLTGGHRVIIANYRGKIEDYQELARLTESGAVTPLIEKTFTLDQAGEAFAALERGGTPGKVVIEIA